MSTDKIEIKLTFIDDQVVDLSNMSVKALESFLSVTNSLKNISELVSDQLTYTIKKGSAYACVNGLPNEIGNIYSKIDEALKGESSDEIVTSNLRSIQKEIQNTVFKYQFSYKGELLDKRLRESKKIAKKRKKQLFENKLEIVSGFFNQIGGNDPNYHFDYGNGNRLTIDCTINETEELKPHLYKTISSLVIKKDFEDKDLKPIFEHKTIIEDELVQPFKEFLVNYYQPEDLIDRLEIIYDFIDNSDKRERNIELLLKAFNSNVFNVSEIKTILVISKSFQVKNECIKKNRDELLKLYESLLKQSR
ncbi:hypothetical protein J2Y38_002063 [Flavobacterium sp. 2755]|uniref:hypothetical protein n=1 Tax=Flavobacterium sp. 2755 TaxID=2817765 RepID=UPI00285962D5|nr:hypothetical protein [Flavobacterium sp. 2755]MDR6761854.1 hypothetical protein [Flavobacterium sp. 2755]